MNVTDYIAKLGISLEIEPQWLRLRYKNVNAVFPGIARETLYGVVNAGINQAVQHYRKTLGDSEAEFTELQLTEAALAVVVDVLYIYNNWRTTSAAHRSQSLVVSVADLSGVRAWEQCWKYCEDEFGAQYRRKCAVLLGVTEQKFSEFEAQRNAFYEMF